MRKKPMPSKNIYWKNIPVGACVEDRRTHFVALLPGGGKAVVNWGSQDARQAQLHLLAASKKTCKPGLGRARRRRK